MSDTEPRKDYTIAPEKYGSSGARELVVFDPMLTGPRSHGGPFLLQVWRRDETGAFTRVHAGDGGRRLRFAEDGAGERLWLTAEEAARAEQEAARARIAELEAQLAAVRRGVE
jgi:hypothetical protein